MNTVYTFVPSPGHVYPGHPEHPGRFEQLIARLNSFDLHRLEPQPATRQEVAHVHHAGLIAALEQVCKQGPAIIDYAPTFVTETSFDDALLAAGAAVTCTRAVLDGAAQNAFAIVRPPGHHAEPDRAMGFCIFNNVAIAARQALEHGLNRVAIVDYDAHHGNGTQAAFLDEPRLAYLSTHQWGIYPGTGWYEEAPHARGRIVNVPLPARAGDKTFVRIAREIVGPFVRSFRPDLLLVSAGFDSHWKDPITLLGLSTAGFYLLSQKLVELAGEYCRGRIVFVLEGGYEATNLANGAAAVFSALTGSETGREANDPSPYPEPDAAERIDQVCRWHGYK